jgi:hypothetical protein
MVDILLPSRHPVSITGDIQQMLVEAFLMGDIQQCMEAVPLTVGIHLAAVSLPVFI